MVGALLLLERMPRDPAGLPAIAQGLAFAAAAHQLSGIIIIVIAPAYKPSFPLSWHQLWPVERDGRIYERLGVPAYRKWLLASPFPRSAPGPPLRITGRSSLANLDKFTRDAEFGHGMLFLTSLPVIGWLAIEQQWAIAIWMVLINIPWNVYPVMLQRYNRARLARVLQRHGLRLVSQT